MVKYPHVKYCDSNTALSFPFLCVRIKYLVLAAIGGGLESQKGGEFDPKQNMGHKVIFEARTIRNWPNTYNPVNPPYMHSGHFVL